MLRICSVSYDKSFNDRGNKMSLPQRKSQRLSNFDYRRGAYFITICTKNARPILSEIRYAQNPNRRDSACGFSMLKLTVLGKICENTLHEVEHKYQVRIPTYIIMPNHIHMILFMPETNLRTATRAVPTVSSVIGAYKSMVTVQRSKIGSARDCRTGALWERSFYDHIIRDDEDLYCKQRYIEENPIRWCIEHGLVEPTSD